MEIRYPPNAYSSPNDHQKVKIFLAGSIEMGKATDWQKTIIDSLSDLEDVVILNPRRQDWDSSWEQKITNPHFKEQVCWEMDALDHADIIAVYFDPNTKSPITLFEVGLHAKSNKMIICCPEGYWRKGNVDIVCERFNISQVKDISGLIDSLKNLF